MTRAFKSVGELSEELYAFNELDGNVDSHQSREPCQRLGSLALSINKIHITLIQMIPVIGSCIIFGHSMDNLLPVRYQQYEHVVTKLSMNCRDHTSSLRGAFEAILNFPKGPRQWKFCLQVQALALDQRCLTTP